MLSYTGARNLFGDLTGDSSSANLTLADTLMNLRRRVILSARKWWFLEKPFTLSTQASTQFLDIPGDIDRILSSPYVTVGSTRYTPTEAPSREFWDQLNQNSYTSDMPEYWFLYNGQLGFYPTPATAGNTITFNAKQKIRDLNIADYTTGTIITTSTTANVTTV